MRHDPDVIKRQDYDAGVRYANTILSVMRYAPQPSLFHVYFLFTCVRITIFC